ncbi:hypothetical protein AVHY2522_09215 [Acidovorax sp. SUPP2522]|uniref:tryptophan 7-halogenase n=1 Tax=unclassified Acidovorax TaxID=2684926 RepID=UPI00234B83F9|nr:MULTISPECIES: tryptophan 7-halogenase [unclassified Acidovorax]WCM97027.1 tryptophan 7-halogenase [Acidovorax sp. GBBC 1281]GKT15745.1 hypothetical protein AVHY2522_09215 [Acidovorax sp. SUPP2522]
MPSAPLQIVVAGGGIGGLTAALALAAQGHRITVCEASAHLKPLGVGINLLPHAVAVLDGLGLLPALRTMGVETAALVFANRHGQPIYEDRRGVAAGYSHPQLSVHRGQLQMFLWDEAARHSCAAARASPAGRRRRHRPHRPCRWPHRGAALRPADRRGRHPFGAAAPVLSR